MFFKLQVSSATGRLRVQLKMYKNPESKTSDGSFCDRYWLFGDCDPYFIFKFEGQKEETDSIGDTTYETFSSNDNFNFQFKRWEVRDYVIIT